MAAVPWRKLLPYLRPHRFRVALALGQVFLMAGFELLKPWPLQIVIDHVLGGRPLAFGPAAGWSAGALLTAACAGIVVVHLGGSALTLWHNVTAIGVGQRMVNDLRGALYAHMQRLSLAFHGRQRVGDLMLRVTGDSFAVQTMVMNGLLPILSAVVLLAGMLYVLVPLDPYLTALSLSIVPLLFLLIAVFNRRIAAVASEVRDTDGRVYSLIQWAMSSIKVIQAFTREEEEHRRFMEASRANLGATLRLYSWQTLYSGVVNTVVAAGTAVVVYAGARSVMSGALTVGQLVVFVSYLAQLYGPIHQITQSWGLIAGARIGVRRVFEILDTEADLKDGTLTFPPGGVRGAVAWNGVSFRYRPEMPVLRHVDVRIEPGMKVAVVGPTGAGKSTLLSLLPRFFDPDAGTVTIDGVDVREFSLKSLRGQIAMVLQPPLIFPIPVRDNIAYGRPEAGQDGIERAARLAHIHDLVMSLPDGYDTVIGEAGATLSEGEKQRLTIARAMLRNAPILILDEPTSSVDTGTEALIMQAIEELMRGRTTFVIAHRLSTVRRAGQILVVQHGAIIERGTFDALMQQRGFFHQLYARQAPEPEVRRAGAV